MPEQKRIAAFHTCDCYHCAPMTPETAKHIREMRQRESDRLAGDDADESENRVYERDGLAASRRA